jgi:ribulose-bisphosphate carboxylase large chain
MSRLSVTYRVQSDAQSISARARVIAIEQSVEMPTDAITDPWIQEDVVGQVGAISDNRDGTFDVEIGLAAETTKTIGGGEPGQLLNMLFGNTSIHNDVDLVDVVFPSSYLKGFRGPNVGHEGLRGLCGANGAMTCTALKPQGLSPVELAELATRFADGGIHFIKDDHGLANQAYSPFADRVRAITKALAKSSSQSARNVQYIPSISGNLDQLRAQILYASEHGARAVLVAPMIIGLPSFYALTQDFRDIAFMAHPAMAGASRIAPPLLLGKMFRLFGADATIFPNYGGRFGYGDDTCGAIAAQALSATASIKRTTPIPAGGMTVDRVPEMLEFYGRDVMFLIGGALLEAGDRLVEKTAEFVARVDAKEGE